MFEVLEKRLLLSASVSGGVLTVIGTAGNDILRVGIKFGGTDLEVQEGLEAPVNFPVDTVTKILIQGLGGNDSLTVEEDVTLPATIDAGGGNDILRGGSGNDRLLGGAGNDMLFGGLGGDFLSGGAGKDLTDYASRSAPIVVLIDRKANDGEAGEKDNIGADVESIFGGPLNDKIVASKAVVSNFLVGNGGNDTLNGGGGDDQMSGGEGDDSMLGGDGDDQMLGAAGKDIMIGGNGDDILNGGDGNDRMDGGPGRDLMAGATGNDTLTGGAGQDNMGGDAGSDLFNAIDREKDVIFGGTERDRANKDGLDKLFDVP